MKTLPRKSEHAFTMIEIAICLAVIGFALVAIIGILPSGLQVQRDNREDTIINQDGTYLLEAIRSGATNLDDLTNYVMEISLIEATPDPTLPREKWVTRNNIFPCSIGTGRQIIGSLSRPAGAVGTKPGPAPYCIAPDPPWELVRVEAKMRSISGNALEKGPLNSTITFEYLVQAQVTPAGPFILNQNQLAVSNLQSNLHDVRLTFRWPLLPGGKIGNSKKVFRTMVGGALTNDVDGYFFTPGVYFVP
jgi:type II secretory pathway pseudopilin PulG